jgi:membrane protease YdiL (CAAX protease family)
MNRPLKNFLDVLLCIAIFAVVQIFIQLAVAGIYSFVKEVDFTTVSDGLTAGKYSDLIVVSSVLSSLVTLLVFTFGKFAVISRNYLASHPWGTLAWVALLSLGLILPAEWVYERLQITMPESTEAMFEGIMREPLGYMAIGIFAPVVEEIVFRGAILRILLGLFSRSWHWVAIIFSALIFGAIHLNLAQGLHAFVIGLLLGWMYYRTSSVVPGILLHWINNTVAYLMFHLMPQFGDGKLIDFFHGDESLMYKGLGCSLLIILPSLFQIARRMKRTDR